LDEKYEGVTEPNGEFSIVEPVEGEARPFKVYLDVGTRRTTTGARIFGCMKGASDGGLYIPHNEKRFPGYDADSKELDSEVLRNYIFGEHVAEYMRMLEDVRRLSTFYLGIILNCHFLYRKIQRDTQPNSQN